MQPKTLVATWAALAAAKPDAPALYDPARGWLTRARLAERSAGAARRLAAAGVRPGDRVLLSGAPSADLVVGYVAVLRLGATVVPANTAYTRPELEHIVGDVTPAAAVLDDPSRVAGLPVAPGAALTPAELADRHQPHGNEDDGAPVVRLDAADPADPALIGFTSGTTGRPKGAVLTQANLLAGARSVIEAWRWTEADRLLLALPLFHMHGLGVGVTGTLTAGASAVLVPRFDPDAVFDAARAHQATMFFGVPTMYARLAASPRLGELAALRVCVSGSAPLPAELWHRIAAGSGQQVLERYGMSETVMLTGNPYEGPRKPGTVGRPLPGVELRLDPETAEVQVRGPNVFAGYWNQPEATASAFTADDWFRTGDIGAFDDDGFLSLVGRTSELIITGGYNVYPREVEEALLAHPAVVDAGVVGLPDPEWGETVAAALVAPDGVDLAELSGFVAERLAGFKRPRRWALVDRLPRNAMGKVQRDAVRALLADA